MIGAPENALASRIESLERTVRRWRYVGVASLAVVGLCVVCGAQRSEKPDDLEVAALRVIDGQGRKRILLTAADTALGPAIVLYDEKGRIRGTFNFNRPGAPMIGMNDAEGKSRVRLAVLPNGRPDLSMYDADGDEIASLP